jgi:hypothetical protein
MSLSSGMTSPVRNGSSRVIVKSFVLLLPDIRISDMQISDAVKSPDMAKNREIHVIILAIITFIAPNIATILRIERKKSEKYDEQGVFRAKDAVRGLFFNSLALRFRTFAPAEKKRFFAKAPAMFFYSG